MYIYIYIDLDNGEIWYLKFKPLDFEVCLATNPSLAWKSESGERRHTARYHCE